MALWILISAVNMGRLNKDVKQLIDKREVNKIDTKKYLSQAFRLDQRINSKLEQVAVLRNLATKATASIHAERVSGTKDHCPMENALVKLISLEQEINAEIDKLVDLKRELAEFIGKLGNPNHRVLLELRYLGGCTWDNVADRMGYDVRWVYRLHGNALKEAAKVFENIQCS